MNDKLLLHPTPITHYSSEMESAFAGIPVELKHVLLRGMKCVVTKARWLSLFYLRHLDFAQEEVFLEGYASHATFDLCLSTPTDYVNHLHFVKKADQYMKYLNCFILLYVST